MAARPYHLIHKGETHVVVAPSAAAAVHHVVGADITDLRPARAAEVAAWARAGKPIPVAGESRVSATIESTPGVPAQAGANDLVPDPAREGWDGTDARAWLLEQNILAGADQAAALAEWDAARAEDRMTLARFDAIRLVIPAFGEAIARFGASVPAESGDQVRASLEENPMTFADVVHAIGEQKRADLYVDEQSTGAPPKKAKS